MRYNILIISFLILQGLYSCGLKSSVYEKNVAIKHLKWSSNEPYQFEFDIKDTSAVYKLFLTMRHTDAYEFSNIWVEMKKIPPSKKDTTIAKIEVSLATEEGKWMGRMFDEIVEHRNIITPNGKYVKFNEKGRYTVILKQIMRKDPLPEVMSIGLRVEQHSE